MSDFLINSKQNTLGISQTQFNANTDFYSSVGSSGGIQTLSQSGNNILLSNGGGSVDIASTTTVANSAQKLTAISYDNGLLETNVDGGLNIGLGSAIGSITMEGGRINIQRDDADPQIEFVKGAITGNIHFNGSNISMPSTQFRGIVDMSSNNIINGNDITLKGTNPSVNFQNTSGVDKASLDYVESSDKITLSGKNVVAEAVGSGSRMLLDSGGSTLWSFDANTTLQRSETGVGIKTIATLQDNGLVQIGTAGVTTFPTLKLQSGVDSNKFLSMSYDSTSDKGIIETGTNIIVDANSGTSKLSLLGDTGSVELASGSGGFYRCGTNTTAGVGAEIIADDGIRLEAISGNVGLLAGNTASVVIAGGPNIVCINGSNQLGVLTNYDEANTLNIPMDVNKLEQLGSNNAYIPMTSYKQDASITVDTAISLVYETDNFVWRYSGQFGPSGLTSESRYCGATRIQVDVNLVAREINADVSWWVELRDEDGGVDYKAIDFKDERYGYVAYKFINPSTGEKNQTISFSTVFDLPSSGTTPSDGSNCRLRLFGWGNASVSSMGNISMVVRPLRNMS